MQVSGVSALGDGGEAGCWEDGTGKGAGEGARGRGGESRGERREQRKARCWKARAREEATGKRVGEMGSGKMQGMEVRAAGWEMGERGAGGWRCGGRTGGERRRRVARAGEGVAVQDEEAGSGTERVRN
ncbi:hypothetical protein GCM10017774_37160 [Lentzea cavernae]|uniref:Uncharacterized protein n=1 Tax=Lentzea cavernae TaxID=2020703 RepID=A0ABQ3ME31_9PSEU|nr:hypothetical protein GCM10017774_37160 [Lentzea cavernae]